MDYETLLGKYTVLLEEVKRLTDENRRLRTHPRKTPVEIKSDEKTHRGEPIVNKFKSVVDNTSGSYAKIQLFMSLFKGRIDVYAKRWENKNKGTSGYSPVCLSQWQAGVCGKPRISCSKCDNKDYAALDEKAIENHLRGNIVVGVYPMLHDETCQPERMDIIRFCLCIVVPFDIKTILENRLKTGHLTITSFPVSHHCGSRWAKSKATCPSSNYTPKS